MLINNDIGFVLSNNSIYKKLKNLFTDLTNNHPENQYLCFTTDNINTNHLGMPMLPLSEAKFYNGNLFVFDLDGASLSRNFPNLNKIFYYIDSIEWINFNHTNYFDLRHIYTENDKIKIIAQNINIDIIYKQCWQKNPIGIMETLSYENFKNIIFSTE